MRIESTRNANEHAIRGGSWRNPARNCRSAYRNWNHPGNSNDDLGFRLCLSSINRGARMRASKV